MQDVSPSTSSPTSAPFLPQRSHFPHYRNGHEIPPYSIVRSGDWKLIRWSEGPRVELCNLREDLSESEDQAAATPETVSALDAQLSSWLREVGARVPRPNPAYRPALDR